MSWGERSCAKRGGCDRLIREACNVDCSEYTWDKVTKPDSVPKKDLEDIPEKPESLHDGLNRAQRRALAKKKRR